MTSLCVPDVHTSETQRDEVTSREQSTYMFNTVNVLESTLALPESRKSHFLPANSDNYNHREPNQQSNKTHKLCVATGMR